MASITARRVLRYQAFPGGRLRSSKGAAYRDMAAHRIRVMLNARWETEPERCVCSEPEYDRGMTIWSGTVCAAHLWFGFDTIPQRSAIIRRYARLLRRADERGDLADPTTTDGCRWPTFSMWNYDDGCASWRCGCSQAQSPEDKSCRTCHALQPPHGDLRDDGFDTVPF